MVRVRFNAFVFIATILCLSGASLGKSFDDAEPALRESEFEPAIVPTSAVATSDNCARIAALEEQFEGGTPAWRTQRIQGPAQGPPLGVSGKFRLALANVSDPFAIVTTALDSEMGNASGSASPLPRGAAGFGERFGVSMAGEASGEFFSTFLFSSLFHQDPHYHRAPDWLVGRRVLHALSYVVITRSDSGKPMFNFAEFLGTASSSVVESGLHPEWQKGAGASAQRIFLSIGSDASWNLMTEFLPDVARHLNPRMMLLRRLAEKAAAQN